VRRLAGAIVCLASLTAAAEAASVGIGPSVRDVTPPGITPAPKVDGPLERIPAPPLPPEPARWWRFELPETTDAATFVTGGRTIRIAGVEPPAADRTCRMPDGAEWPCGRMALTSLRMFLRGRPVECYYRLSDAAADFAAPCRVGPTDLGAWLLTQGWVTPGERAGDDYRRGAEEARCARRGLWRGELPPDSCLVTPGPN
jgi:endonuclease YncB( thermonuclease family)